MSAPSDVLGVLKTVFPSLDEATMLRVLEKHKDSYGAAVDELLTINSEPQGQLDQEDDRSPAMNNAHAPQLDAVKRVTEMFPELTMSVIGGALHFNQGEAEGAIDMLLNIGQDQEAITQIRDMNPERKAQVRCIFFLSSHTTQHRISLSQNTIFSLAAFSQFSEISQPSNSVHCIFLISY